MSMGRAGIYTVDANPSARPGPRVGPDGDESRPCENELPDIELSRMRFGSLARRRTSALDVVGEPAILESAASPCGQNEKGDQWSIIHKSVYWI